MATIGTLCLLGLAGCGQAAGPTAAAPPTTTASAAAVTTPPATSSPAPAEYDEDPSCAEWPAGAAGSFQGNAIQVELKPELRGPAASGYSCLTLFADQSGLLTLTVRRFAGNGSSGADQARQYTETNVPAGSEPVSGLGDEAWWTADRCLLTARVSNLHFEFETKSVDETRPVTDCRSRVESLAQGYLELHT